MTPRLVLDEQLCFVLYGAGRAVTHAYREGLGRLGLTYPQFITLLALWEEDGPTVSELGARLHLDSGTLSPLLKRLEAAGHVVRRRSTDDERQVTVHLTEAGSSLREQAGQIQTEAYARLGLTPEEAVLLHKLSGRVCASVLTPETA